METPVLLVLRLKSRSDLFWLPDWDAVTVGTLWRVGLGRTLENSHLSPCICVHAAWIWKSILFFCILPLFVHWLAGFYLDRSNCMTCFLFVFNPFWKRSRDNCTVTGFQYACVCLEKEIWEQEHSNSEWAVVHRQAMNQECVVLELCVTRFCLCNVPSWSDLSLRFPLINFYWDLTLFPSVMMFDGAHALGYCFCQSICGFWSLWWYCFFCDFIFYLINKWIFPQLYFTPCKIRRKKKEIKFCIKKIKPIFWDDKDFWNVTF